MDVKMAVVNNMTGFNWHTTSKSDQLFVETITPDGFMRLRPWGIECFKKVHDKNLAVINSPTGSGKSVVAASIVYKKLENNPKLRGIVAVPQTMISKGFINQKNIDLCVNGKRSEKFIWSPHYDLCIESKSDSRSDELIAFLKRPVVNRAGKSIHTDVNERILICCFQTLVLTHKKLFGPDVSAEDKKENRKLWKNLVLVVDEAHHIKGGEDDKEGYLPESPNELGNIIVDLCENRVSFNNHALLVTATFFRGDRKSLLPKSIYDYFTRFDLPYDIWLGQMRWFKHFTYDFVVGSKGVAHQNDYFAGFERCFKSLFNSGHSKIIAYIPKRQSRWDTKDKPAEVRKVLSIIKKVLRCSKNPTMNTQTGVITFIGKNDKGQEFQYKVLDLVSEEKRKKKREFFTDENFNNSPDTIDCILALDMFKEGCDWVHANGMIITGNKKSLTDVMQMIGRLFRDVQGKATAKIMHLLPFSPGSLPMDENLNAFFKCIGMYLLLENIFNPIRIKIKDRKDGGDDEEVRMVQPRMRIFENLPLDLNQRNEIMVGVQEELVKVAGQIQRDNGTYTPKQLRAQMPEIMQSLLAGFQINLPEDELCQVSDEVYFMFPRRTLELQGYNVNDITWDMMESADPIEFILKYVSKKCDQKALLDLRAMISRLQIEAEEWVCQIIQFMKKNGDRNPQQKSKNLYENKLSEKLSTLKKAKKGQGNYTFYPSLQKMAEDAGYPNLFETEDLEANAQEDVKKIIEFKKNNSG
jgi:superfamily II DNA or RNA helicase